MVDLGVYLITPKLDAKGLTYPALASVFPDKSESEIDDFLDKLRSAGILKSKLLDKVIVCPTCGSPSVYSKYNCPRCSSFDIGKASIIEHVRCGYIGSKEKFQKGNLLICPKCKNTVGEVDYRKIGTSFECNSCGSRFEAPRMSHKCNSCDDVFTYKEARYEPIFEFELSEETKRSVAKGTLPLGSIVTTLKEGGFEVGLKSDLIGKSGATHNFDIVARKGAALVVANFTFEPKEEDIIGLFAKKYDVDPTFTLLIALTPPSKEEEAVSKAYAVTIVSSTGSRSIGEQIIDLVNEYFREKGLSVKNEAASGARSSASPFDEEVKAKSDQQRKISPLETQVDLSEPVDSYEKQGEPAGSRQMREQSDVAADGSSEQMPGDEKSDDGGGEGMRTDGGDQRKRKKSPIEFEADDWDQYDF